MRAFSEDWSEESVPLVRHKGNQEPDILSKRCELCGKVVQIVNGKASKHKCLGDE